MSIVNYTKENYEELKSFCIYLYDKHYDEAINIDTEELVTEPTPAGKVAIVLGYGSESIYNYSSKPISERSYNLFKKKFSDLANKKDKSPKDQEVLEKVAVLLEKMYIQNDTGKSVKFSNIVTQFAGKSWYIFERLHTGEDAIGRKFVIFDDIIDHRMAIKVGNFQESGHYSKGYAYVDSLGDYLVMETSSGEKNALPTHYMIRVDKEAITIDMCIGHKTVKSPKRGNIISKTVVFKKLSFFKNPEATILKLTNNDTRNSVSDEIYKFLIDPALNRLSSPHNIVSTSKGLKNWQEQNLVNKKKSINPISFGEYDIYYKGHIDRVDLTTDYLSIEADENDEVIAIYRHTLSGSKTIQEFRGKISYSKGVKALFITLHGYSEQFRDENNIIFLILNTPLGAPYFSILTGVISGFQDDYTFGSIGLLVVAHKNPALPKNKDIGYESFKEATKEKVEPEIRSFFYVYKDRSIILPPSLPVSIIAELTQCTIRLKSEKQSNIQKELDI